LLLIGIVLANASASFWNIRTLAASHRLTVHTHEVLTQIQVTLSLLKDAETGQRGYLISGETRYLKPFDDAVGGINERVRRLRALTADNAGQQVRIEALTRLIADRFDELNTTLAARTEHGFEAARAIVLADRGKKNMDEIRDLMAAMEAEERQLTKSRTAEAERRVHFTLTMLVFATVVVVISAYLRRLASERHRMRPNNENPTVRIPLAAQVPSPGSSIIRFARSSLLCVLGLPREQIRERHPQ
jgi:CHASE3 domain sensor protein